MALNDKFKTLNDKIKANKAQYSLDREAAKRSALSSGKFNKYDYLISEETNRENQVWTFCIRSGFYYRVKRRRR